MISIQEEGAYYQNEYYAIIKNNRIDNESKALISEIVEYISSVDVQERNTIKSMDVTCKYIC